MFTQQWAGHGIFGHDGEAGLERLAAEPGEGLKQCPGEHCGWFFLGTTRRGNRRWCSMDECGQDAKVARRRRRSAADA